MGLKTGRPNHPPGRPPPPGRKTPHRLPQSSAIAALLAEALRRALPHQVAERLVHHPIATLTRLEAASEAGARGNLKVFAEIAHEFARFLTEFAHTQTPDDQRIAAFCATLRPGPPPNGQHYLQQAFTHYYRARFTEDPKARTELLLLASIEVGLHEQTRLQPEITAALTTPIRTPQFLTHELPPHTSSPLPHTPSPRPRTPSPLPHIALPLITLLRATVETLLEPARTLTRKTITKLLLTLTLPNNTHLDLSDDLTATYPAP
ncbi:hypothetical protein DFQ13_11667 [Actinokineospora spheciospongiae]|nr:hypothetical protein DFQ13_11667 [Actinokineospora spheciospongiae]